MKLELVATCLFGLEKLLGEEIDALGYKRIDTMDGRITYEGDERAVFVSNLHLRFAERVFIKLGSAHVESFSSPKRQVATSSSFIFYLFFIVTHSL